MQQEKTSPWLIALRLIFTAALLCSIAFIFRNSMQVAAESAAQSQASMHSINVWLGKIHLGPLSEHTVRKLAHFAEFMMEGFWLMLCLRVYTNRFVRHISWPLLGGGVTALADETIQIWTPGRSSSVVDVWIDSCGVVAGVVAALILLLVVRGCTAYYRIKQENRALRAERDAYRREEQQREHEHLARRAAHRAANPNPTAPATTTDPEEPQP